jgi:hypothetical protein
MDSKQLIENHVYYNATQLLTKMYECGDLMPDDLWDYQDQEILQWWLVSERLGRVLMQCDQKVYMLFGLWIWGRQTAGLSLIDDDVIAEAAEKFS